MINLFNRHKEAGTCGFASWCDFVDWLHSAKPDKSKLGSLKELSAKAYAGTLPKAEKHLPVKEEPAAEAVPQADAPEPKAEEAPKPKKRKKAGD